MIRNKHFWIAYIGLTIISLIVIFLPFLTMFVNSGFDTRATYPLYGDNYHYAAMYSDVTEGHTGLGNAYYYEGKDAPYIQSPQTYEVVSYILKPLHLSVPVQFAIIDVIWCLICPFLLLLVFSELINKKSWAYGGVLVFLLFSLTSDFTIFLHKVAFLVFVLAFYIALKLQKRVLEGGNTLTVSIFLGIVMGISLYMYPYYVSMLVVVIGLQALVGYVNSANRAKFMMDYIPAGLISLLIAIPYFAHLLGVNGNAEYIAGAARILIINSHLPSSLINVFIISTAIVLLMILWKSLKLQVIDKTNFIAFSIAPVIVNWQNIVSGQYVQFSSHYLMVTFLLWLLVVIGILIKYNEWNNQVSKAVKVISLLIVLVPTLYISKLTLDSWGEWFSYTKSFSTTTFPTRDTMILNWLNANTKADDVVYTSDYGLSMNIPVYTDDNVYYNFYAAYYAITDSDADYRWVMSNYYNDDVDMTNLGTSGSPKKEVVKFYSKYRILLPSFVDEITRKLNTELELYNDGIIDLTKQLREKDFMVSLKKFRVDYVVCNKEASCYEYFMQKKIKPVYLDKEYYVFKI